MDKTRKKKTQHGPLLSFFKKRLSQTSMLSLFIKKGKTKSDVFPFSLFDDDWKCMPGSLSLNTFIKRVQTFLR